MRTSLLIAGIALAVLNCAAVSVSASEGEPQRRGMLVTLAVLDLVAMATCAYFL